MRRFYTFAVFIAAGIVVASPAGATDAGQSPTALVAAGHAFSLKVCWACHVVATDQIQKPILSHPAPSFLVIAQKSDLTDATLRHFLASHTKMLSNNDGTPNPPLLDDQINEVAAYIESLKK